ncbi:glucosaminidase domain-containing protein [Clostridium ganghwense]|uniref:Glucosaminidase domain-containing protein n=1 Tax=Clostridium ganghwense TaxID=312089 RepID=A0ABT4CMA8_9CLOT|nr:glucosaminidase domain-containing protein [Clostridium ganghwense]MCY6370068.1 glucosaminidase domain-containing protein [Clostridium ganghwense]
MVLFILISLFQNSYCYANETLQEVDSQKEWIIKFNQSIDPININNKNIFVIDSNDNIVNDVNVTLSNLGQAIKVIAPPSGYKPNEIYTLIITNNICSSKGQKVKDLKTKKFIVKEKNQVKTPIMGKSDLSVEQMAKYVLTNNANPKLSVTIQDLAKIFLEEGSVEGVRGDIAFCQSIKETGYFKYGGLVLPEQNNFAGIGSTNNSRKGKGAWFKNAREGVRAQIQHLKGYATKEALKNPCIDPRYPILKSAELLGAAPNWEDLNGTWAVPGNNYGQGIIKIYKKIKQIK